jgi:hypothetical protein
MEVLRVDVQKRKRPGPRDAEPGRLVDVMRSDREQKLLCDGDNEADGKACCGALDAFIAGDGKSEVRVACFGGHGGLLWFNERHARWGDVALY